MAKSRRNRLALDIKRRARSLSVRSPKNVNKVGTFNTHNLKQLQNISNRFAVCHNDNPKTVTTELTSRITILLISYNT